MALLTKLSQVLSPASAGGNTVVTGIGFRPKAAIVFGTRTAGTQGLAGPGFLVGVDDGIGHRYARAMNGGLFSGQHFTDGWMTNGHSFLQLRMQGLNELMVQGYILSFDADGYTVHWDFILVATGVKFYVLLIGGSTFDARALGLQPNTTTYSVTSLPWQPAALFGVHLGGTFDNVLLPDGGVLTLGVSGAFSCGQATGCGSSLSAFGGAVTTRGYVAVGEWLSVINQSTGGLGRRIIVTSLDPHGFTVNNFGGGTYGVLAMTGCTFNAGSFVQPAAPGLQTVPLLAAQPRAAILWSHGKTTTGAVLDCLFSFGIGDLSGQKAVWTGALTGFGVGSERANCVQDDTHIGIAHTPTGGFASTLHTRVSLAGFSGGLQLLWEQVDGVPRLWHYGVFAEDIGTGPCGHGCFASICADAIPCTPVPGANVHGAPLVTVTQDGRVEE